MPKAIDLTGQVFGRLTAVERTEERRGGSFVWRCVCRVQDGHIGSEDQECFVPVTRLRPGGTQSCGCLHSEQLSARNHSANPTRKYLCPFSAARLQEMYRDSFMSCPEIAALAAPILGQPKIKGDVVRRWLAESSIPLRPAGLRQKAWRRRFPLKSRAATMPGLSVIQSLAGTGRLIRAHASDPQFIRRVQKARDRTHAIRAKKRNAEQLQAQDIERALNGETFL